MKICPKLNTERGVLNFISLMTEKFPLRDILFLGSVYNALPLGSVSNTVPGECIKYGPLGVYNIWSQESASNAISLGSVSNTVPDGCIKYCPYGVYQILFLWGVYQIRSLGTV